jgi:hypothetical protein
LYREILYIKLFPYTKAPRSSLSAPLCIGKILYIKLFPIPDLPKSKCGYRRKRDFLRLSQFQAKNTDFSAPNCLLQCLKSVFHFLLLQKHRLSVILQKATSYILCAFLPLSSKTQNFTDYKIYYKLKTLCFKQYLA